MLRASLPGSGITAARGQLHENDYRAKPVPAPADGVGGLQRGRAYTSAYTSGNRRPHPRADADAGPHADSRACHHRDAHPRADADAAPTPTVAFAETATPDPLARFAPPDPVEGVGEVREALIAGRLFRLEVARTPSERAHGLMERANLPQEDDMLFVFEAEEYRGFWMKNTLIPLDILFLDARGVVVDVQTMYPQIGALSAALKVYRSARPARYALEMNAGLAESLGIAPGTQVLFG